MITQRFKKVRLLLVEDSDSDAFLIDRAARELSFDLQVERFVSAIAAIAGLQAGRHAIADGALLDLNLPGGSGLDVLRVIRDNERTRHLPVVVMTSSISARDREIADQLGVEAYLAKPNGYDQFVDTVGLALRMILREGAPRPKLPAAPRAARPAARLCAEECPCVSSEGIPVVEIDS
jgi:CheY-like chemotaxis protein